MRRSLRLPLRLAFTVVLAAACASVMVLTSMIAFRVRAHALNPITSARIPKANVNATRHHHAAEAMTRSAGRREARGQTQNAERAFWNASPATPRGRSTRPNRSHFEVTVPVSGQLGNRMFQYASLLGIAERNGGRTAFYRPSSALGGIFQVTRLADRPDKGFRVVHEKDFATYDSVFESLPPENVALLQYLQSWRYFDFIRGTILREFTFLHSVKDSAADLLKRYSAGTGRNKTRVGVHVRRGDLLRVRRVPTGYHTAPASYVRKAMDYMRQRHGDVIFIFVTDDVSWCRREFRASDDVVIADGAPAEVHLAVLASCDHVIMTVGTYGWWGAYLAGGDVIYYWDRAQCLHDPPLPVEIKRPQDFFLPSWVPLTG